MSGKNLIRKTFFGNDSWTAPAGVRQVRAQVFGALGPNLAVQSNGAGPETGFTFLTAMTGDAYGIGGPQSILGTGTIGNGVGTVTSYSSPVLVSGSLKWRMVNGPCGIARDGNVYTWGSNSNGQLGLGDHIYRSTPTLVTSPAASWRWVQGNEVQTFFVNQFGFGYGAGLNSRGQLGDGTVLDKSIPTAISGSLFWRMIVANGASTYGITTTGLLYAWGLNDAGQLGVGDTIPRSTPTLVLGGQKWKTVHPGCSSGGSSGAHAVGITTSGDMYAWGGNNFGMLGSGISPATSIAVSSPVLVVGGLKWRSCAANEFCSYGLTRESQLYFMGAGGILALSGNGPAVADASSPTLVTGGATYWRAINAGSAGGSFVVGIDTSGQGWGWGANTDGQLGNGTVATTTSPTLILGSVPWRSIDRVLLHEVIVDVTPGTSYNVSLIGSTVATFGPVALYSESMSTAIAILESQTATANDLNIELSLEYFA